MSLQDCVVGQGLSVSKTSGGVEQSTTFTHVTAAMRYPVSTPRNRPFEAEVPLVASSTRLASPAWLMLTLPRSLRPILSLLAPLLGCIDAWHYLHRSFCTVGSPDDMTPAFWFVAFDGDASFRDSPDRQLVSLPRQYKNFHGTRRFLSNLDL